MTTTTPSPTRIERLLKARIDFCILGYYLGTGHLVDTATVPITEGVPVAHKMQKKAFRRRRYARFHDESDGGCLCSPPPPHVETTVGELVVPSYSHTCLRLD